MVGQAGSCGSKASIRRVRLLNRRRDIGTRQRETVDSRARRRARHAHAGAGEACAGSGRPGAGPDSAGIRPAAPTLRAMARRSPLPAAWLARMLLACALLPWAASALAQDEDAEAPPARQPENVRIEFAQVLRAEPVYQTLRATSMVERCEASTPVEDADETKTGLARVIGAVKGALTPD